jgi:hypothetical protein
MSYARMDHAEWVESNNRAINARNGASSSRRRKVAPAVLPEKLSDFQKRVADIVGMVAGGVYNAPINWNNVEWNLVGGRAVSVVWRFPHFATWDFDGLTKLVFLAHEARIRVELEPAATHYMRVTFHQRAAAGCGMTRHPNLEEATAAFRAYLPSDHRIIYREPEIGTRLVSDVRVVSRIDADAKRARVTIRAPKFLAADSSGDVRATEAMFRIELRAGGGWTVVDCPTLRGKSASEYRHSYDVDLAAEAGPWEIGVTRISADVEPPVFNALWLESVEPIGAPEIPIETPRVDLSAGGAA